jgi:hypothetical protein
MTFIADLIFGRRDRPVGRGPSVMTRLLDRMGHSARSSAPVGRASGRPDAGIETGAPLSHRAAARPTEAETRSR